MQQIHAEREKQNVYLKSKRKQYINLCFTPALSFLFFLILSKSFNKNISSWNNILPKR